MTLRPCSIPGVGATTENLALLDAVLSHLMMESALSDSAMVRASAAALSSAHPLAVAILGQRPMILFVWLIKNASSPTEQSPTSPPRAELASSQEVLLLLVRQNGSTPGGEGGGRGERLGGGERAGGGGLGGGG